jgi:DNA-binding PadR family transcriptional regulator
VQRISGPTRVHLDIETDDLAAEVARLEAAGAVRVVAAGAPESEPPVPVVPMTGSIAGEAAAFRARRATGRRATGRSSRTRKVYAITDVGERLFAELLATDTNSADDDRAFNLRLAFCRYLPPDDRLGLLERRRAQLVARLARSRSGLRARRERLDAYRQSLMDHGTEATERDISWLDGLIALERRHGGHDL